MKLITRTRDRVLFRRQGEPKYRKWSQWSVCEATEGLTREECQTLILDWSDPDFFPQQIEPDYFRNRDPYTIDEYRIVADNFDVASYNAALKD